MSTVNGLPAHVLLVHAVVVLVPATAVLLVLVACWPAARRRLVPLTAVVALIALAAVPLTTEAGEWLEHRLPRSQAIETHTHLGDGMLPWAIGLAVVALAFVARDLVAHRRRATGVDDPAPASSAALPGGAAVSVVLLVLAVVVGAGSVVTVYRIGDSGARAAWTGSFSATPLPRAAKPSGGE